MRETECFFAEHVYEFLLFLNTPLVKDTSEFVECVLCVTTERRDVLRRILPDVDGSCDNGDFVLLLASPLTGMEMFGAISLGP